MKKILLLIISVFLIVGCSSQPQENKKVSFHQYLRQIFVEDMENDYLTMHSSLIHPEKYDIKVKKISFGNIDDKNIDYKKRLKTLESYKDSLSGSDKTYYKILHRTYEDQVKMDDDKDEYMDNICDPNNSFTENMATSLLEFRFDNENDIKNYIKLIESGIDYCKQAVAYLKKQSEEGYFMSSRVSSEYLQSLNKLMTSSWLVSSFNKRTFSFSLSDEKKEKYGEDVKKAYGKSLYPGFKLVKEAVLKYKNTSKNASGLSELKNGKSYFEARVQSILGVDDSLSQMKEKAIALAKQSSDYIQSHLNAELYYKITASNSTGLRTYRSVIQDLLQRYQEDFEKLDHIDYEISAMDQSNASSSTLAYYVNPTLDGNETNIIRVNENSTQSKDSLDAYSTLAHESIPGHMYQFNYARMIKRPEILYTVSYLGYAEGYATYVQDYAYKYAPHIDSDVKDILLAEQHLQYALVILSMIGIHNDSYSKTDVKRLWSDYQMNLSFTEVSSLYNQMLDSPFMMCPYYLGYMYIKDIQKNMKSKLGDKYTNKAFNKALVANGNVPIALLESTVIDSMEK